MVKKHFQDRRRRRKKQHRINQSLKRKLFGHMTATLCRYCQKSFTIDQLTIEHIVPHILGGTNDEINIDLACSPCNQQKGKEAWEVRKLQLREKYHGKQRDFQK